MSWEEISREDSPCKCGKSTMTRIFEMDDWNRTRNHTEIQCPVCHKEAIREIEEKEKKEKQRALLYEQAKNIALQKYLNQWLEKYEGLNKKQAWLLLSSGSGYPSLATFYKHTKEEGLLNYLTRQFNYDFCEILKEMNISDSEITNLINKRSNI